MSDNGCGHGVLLPLNDVGRLSASVDGDGGEPDVHRKT